MGKSLSYLLKAMLGLVITFALGITWVILVDSSWTNRIILASLQTVSRSQIEAQSIHFNRTTGLAHIQLTHVRWHNASVVVTAKAVSMDIDVSRSLLQWRPVVQTLNLEDLSVSVASASKHHAVGVELVDRVLGHYMPMLLDLHSISIHGGFFKMGHAPSFRLDAFHSTPVGDQIIIKQRYAQTGGGQLSVLLTIAKQRQVLFKVDAQRWRIPWGAPGQSSPKLNSMAQLALNWRGQWIKKHSTQSIDFKWTSMHPVGKARLVSLAGHTRMDMRPGYYQVDVMDTTGQFMGLKPLHGSNWQVRIEKKPRGWRWIIRASSIPIQGLWDRLWAEKLGSQRYRWLAIQSALLTDLNVVIDFSNAMLVHQWRASLVLKDLKGLLRGQVVRVDQSVLDLKRDQGVGRVTIDVNHGHLSVGHHHSKRWSLHHTVLHLRSSQRKWQITGRIKVGHDVDVGIDHLVCVFNTAQSCQMKATIHALKIGSNTLLAQGAWPKGLRLWMDRVTSGVLLGQIKGQFDLARPIVQAMMQPTTYHGVVMNLKLRDARVRFHQQWPEATITSGQLVRQGQDWIMRNLSGYFVGIAVNQGRLIIRPNQTLSLDLVAPRAALMKLSYILSQLPYVSQLSHLGLKGEGTARIALHGQWQLGRAMPKYCIGLDFAFTKASLQWTPWLTKVALITAHSDFDGKGFAKAFIEGQIEGGTSHVVVKRRSDRVLEVQGQAQVSSHLVREYLGATLAGHLLSSVPITVHTTVPLALTQPSPAHRVRPPFEVQLHSPLDGPIVEALWGKYATVNGPIIWQIHNPHDARWSFRVGSRLHLIDYGPTISINQARKIHLNLDSKQPIDIAKLWRLIHQIKQEPSRLNQWLNSGKDQAWTLSTTPLGVNGWGQTFAKVPWQIARHDRVLQFIGKSDDNQLRFVYQPDQDDPIRLFIEKLDLSQCKLPSTSSQGVSNMRIEVAHLGWKNHDLGALDLIYHPRANALSRLRLVHPEYQVDGSLRAILGSLQPYQLKGRAKIQSEAALYHLAWQIPWLKHLYGKGHIDFVFNASSLSPINAIEDVIGQIQIKMHDGMLVGLDQHIERKMSIARLINVLSLNSIKKRLRLDFRDFIRGGLSFKSLAGTIDLHHGQARALLTANGDDEWIVTLSKMHVIDQKMQTDILVVPKVTASIPVVVAMTAGVLPGAVLWGLSRMLNQSIEHHAGFGYRLTGTMHHPTIQPLPTLNHQYLHKKIQMLIRARRERIGALQHVV